MKIIKLFTLALLVLFGACQNAENNETDLQNTQQIESSSQFGGLALYTIRDTIAQNPKAVLEEVAAIGYKNIEAAGYADGKFYGMSPDEFKALLDEVGLVPVSSHHGDVTLENADEMIAAVKAVGFKYFVIPIPPMGHFKYDPETRTLGMSDEVEEISNIINTIAEKCSKAGLQCLYHNHNMEFVENSKGIVPIDYFIENSNPEHLNFEMDLYWVVKAGADPLTYFEKAPGRFKVWHVKDMDEQGRFAPVGTGSIKFADILAQKDKAGLEHYFVEQDATFEQTPFEAITISHKALSEIGFE